MAQNETKGTKFIRKTKRKEKSLQKTFINGHNVAQNGPKKLPNDLNAIDYLRKDSTDKLGMSIFSTYHFRNSVKEISHQKTYRHTFM